MIWNPFAIIDGFISIIRLCVGLFVVVFALRAWFIWHCNRTDPDRRENAENTYYLLLMMATLLLVLNLLAWPVFYLLLQSYVREWPGVMCIYGVTRIGDGSIGTSRFLPQLVSALEIAKPAVVFLSGLWFVLHRINLKTDTAQLTGRILLVMAGAAFLAVADTTTEIAYLTIPKKEVFPSAGCCTGIVAHAEGNARFLPQPLVGIDENSLFVAYYACNSITILAVYAFRMWTSHRQSNPWLVALVGAAIATTVMNAIFVIDVVAPRLLGTPDHHCPYDLVPGAPESLIGVALFVMGGGAVGWAALATWLSGGIQPESSASGITDELLQLASTCYLVSLLWISAELILK
jgi:hypothetical protein